MTIEEKSKAYDGALERARNLENTTSEEEALINYIFPELSESEDERIRKRLIDCLKFSLKGAEEQDAAACSRQKDIEAYKWGIAYLEKQKEQKPWEKPLDLTGLLIPPLPVKQKPAEWGEDEKKILDFIIDDYKKANKSFCGYAGKIVFLEAIRDGKYNLPKQVWSEEDEKMLEIAEECATNKDFVFETSEEQLSFLDWLKSLPKRFNLQPKQGWSEEDKKKIKNAIDAIIQKLNMEGQIEAIEFLKSLIRKKDQRTGSTNL